MQDRILGWSVFVVAVIASCLVHFAVREIDQHTRERQLAIGEVQALRREALIAGSSDPALRSSVVKHLDARLARARTSPISPAARFGFVDRVGGPRLVLADPEALRAESRPAVAPR